jgi:D-threonine aldolase
MAWYNVKNIDVTDTPNLLVYKERVQQNIGKAIAMLQSVGQLRPHVKTHKIKAVALMQQEAGINKFKCATIAEGEMLGEINAADVLIAYLIIGPKIKRLQALREKFTATHFSCLIDNFEAAKCLSENFLNNPLPVYIDLNVGMNRTGILPEKAFQLFKDCSQLKGTEIIGLHAYDGHIHDINISERIKKANEIFNTIQSAQKEIEKFSSIKIKIVTAGSFTFKIHAAQNKEVEVSPGTFVFWDEGYRNMIPDFDFLFAALIVTRVVSIIDKKTVCLDLGYKAVASENPLPRVRFLNVEDAKVTGQSEEHITVEVTDSSVHKVGDVWYGVPIHICPTIALYQEVMVVENETISETWKVIARDRKITI